jgi:3-phenylpropionate/trans-cinnamate dioxygenase ferredoxin reductase subunit
VTAIDRARQRLALSDGSWMPYGRLALCTGGRPRPLQCAGLEEGASPANLLYLRTLADAMRIRAQLRPGARVIIVGGGYVGLELAASARLLGAEVTLLEAQARVLARVAGPQVSAFYEAVHRAQGVQVASVACQDGRIVSVACDDGERLQADLVIAGVGMMPNVEVAQAAGLADELGIRVDELSRTRDPLIVAAGDCTVHRSLRYQRDIRLESVPNALEQARAAASWLVGKPRPNQSVPWFWSDQYDLKLQMAGLSQGHDRCVLRGSPDSRSFCAFYLRGHTLLAVDAVNRPAEFMAVRRALASASEVDAGALADEAVPLKDVLGAAGSSAGNHRPAASPATP